MAKHSFNPGKRNKVTVGSTKNAGVTFKKVSTSDRTKAPEVQAPTKLFNTSVGGY